jgi:hypothetical protein
MPDPRTTKADAPRGSGAAPRYRDVLPEGEAFKEHSDDRKFQVLHTGVGAHAQGGIVDAKDFGPGATIKRMLDLGAIRQLTSDEVEALVQSTDAGADTESARFDPQLATGNEGHRPLGKAPDGGAASASESSDRINPPPANVPVPTGNPNLSPPPARSTPPAGTTFPGSEKPPERGQGQGQGPRR